MIRSPLFNTTFNRTTIFRWKASPVTLILYERNDRDYTLYNDAYIWELKRTSWAAKINSKRYAIKSIGNKSSPAYLLITYITSIYKYEY